MEQSVPSDHSLAEVLALHKIWLETEGKKGQQADLSDADSRGAVLCAANFRWAVLAREGFSEADLRNAEFRAAILRECIIAGTDMRGADVRGADLDRAKVRMTSPRRKNKGVAKALVASREAREVSRPHRLPSSHTREFGPDITVLR